MRERDDEVLVEQVRELRSSKIERGTADILGERRRLSEPMTETEVNRRMFLRSLFSFLSVGVAGWTAFLAWRWMSDETKYNLLRRTFEFNERVSQIFYKPERLSPEFSPAAISPRRVNGELGMTGEFDAANWRLRIGGLANQSDDLILTLDEIKQLPRTEMITELKCIEGWSVIVQWAGVRFSDFVEKLGINKLPHYVSMTTPDNEYFVGWDIESIMHPQTLLAYEMNGEPLLPEHGAPLRLASPTKYGIKQIKRIGRIEFTNVRPRDYWAESGYDWYSGH